MISVFSHHASYIIAFILFTQSVMLSVLSFLIGRSTLRLLATGDIGMSRLAVCALRSDSPLPTMLSKSHTVSGLGLGLRRTSLLCCNSPCNRFISVQTGLKERATTNEINASWSKNREGILQRSCFPMSLMLKLTLAF